MKFSSKKSTKARLLAILATSVLVAAALVACGQRYFQEAPTKVSNFKGQLVEGGISSYQAEKGQATLIVLTASWCPGCRAEVPHLKKIDTEFAEQGLKILRVSDDDSPQAALQYKKAAKIPWTTFHWNYEIMNALGNPGVIPVTYLVNAQDSIVRIDVGGFDEEVMRTLVGKLVGSRQ